MTTIGKLLGLGLTLLAAEAYSESILYGAAGPRLRDAGVNYRGSIKETVKAGKDPKPWMGQKRLSKKQRKAQNT